MDKESDDVQGAANVRRGVALFMSGKRLGHGVGDGRLGPRIRWHFAHLVWRGWCCVCIGRECDFVAGVYGGTIGVVLCCSVEVEKRER